MKFVKYDGVWYEQIAGDCRLYNYNGGFIYFNPIAIPEQTMECENWHELYLKTDFTIGVHKNFSAWLSPEGKFYYCKSHYVGAEEILEVIFNEIDNNGSLKQADDILSNKGFIRLTTTAMWDIYLNEFKEKSLTQMQIDKIFEWCNEHGLNTPRF